MHFEHLTQLFFYINFFFIPFAEMNFKLKQQRRKNRMIFQCHSIERHKLLTESRSVYKVARDHPRTCYRSCIIQSRPKHLRVISSKSISGHQAYSRPPNNIDSSSGNGNNISWSHHIVSIQVFRNSFFFMIPSLCVCDHKLIDSNLYCVENHFSF